MEPEERSAWWASLAAAHAQIKLLEERIKKLEELHNSAGDSTDYREHKLKENT